jgi:hypothetical protein
MSSKEPSRQDLEGRLFLVLNNHEPIHLRLKPTSFRGFLEWELRQIYDFLESPEIRNSSAVRPKCPITPSRRSMGSGSTYKYKEEIAKYIEEKCGIGIESPSKISLNALETFANYLDSLE